ncbi:MAG: transposase [Candidatus Raymondbacteria bacterium RifOxyA12_full_50_37]|uniref:Transposase n=1 Tax=Candidatus Raymondbacteria bacterium RIFOXYD12_FULL_49_13 TaxID=1817890 RepID=A0A1F7FAZ6_UNCRA|nr:MAG: transposase [Candidatus Raymondbacteria bacterium RifOxyA12_full_50_37]OGJ88816.1 MAG: transposase [Candidatus Raymondbacteria bacterium RifOxyB12_full_50_8]OGJ92522.1 MAG: transposase [Candidatus Raymondbacteria bacterium RIFOXYA2_FULL_49_16]OGJ97734.1 MAG: transposase [Candidatus Raymondbacteria bacterium RifOxyC12_full_50_8]OGJ97876.1 MAG: transposase [Candidatus Raymondbacteria bacterium RIFOXYC2_FULL_50_21]OGK03845.1 MAG: transposase [Candidatus Raymondbacteria bacterium RIFOXYD12
MSAATKAYVKNVKIKYRQLSFCLNEKSKRLWAATEANSIGRGGINIVHKTTGIDFKTIRKGIKELTNKGNGNRIRSLGGGRKRINIAQRDILKDLEKLIEPVTRGDPESSLLWTCKSTYKLSDELKAQGYTVSQKTVYSVLVDLDYSLQSNRKRREGTNHPDRNEQFEYIYKKVKEFQANGYPTISVDTKKKEAIGEYKNQGREYRIKGKPLEVNMHAFPDKKLGKVAFYGVYDIGKNKGWVSVGISSDTAEFAVNTIRSWWHVMGKPEYKKIQQLLITADCGGSNGYRVKLWKYELQKLANELGITITVCHFPPGTSKWNEIEHRMFSYITKNWRGRPLETRETVVQLISNTRTKTGLEIKAILDNNIYEKGKLVDEAEMLKINQRQNKFHGEWNYQILPHK